MSLRNWAGRRAVVTGCSQGIGRATCQALLGRGTRVFGLAIDAEKFADQPDFTPLRCDLSRPEDVRKAFDIIRQGTCSLDYLVNVAGIDPKYSLDEGNEGRWGEIVDLNLRGYYLVIREAVPLLRKGRSKSIVNVSSINYRLT